jgi:dihydropteroate synthase
MHMQGEPRTMQQNPVYKDVVDEVCQYLSERVAVCEKAGIPRSRLLIDPGFGFGKSVSHNLDLLRNLRIVTGLGLPVVAGLSRKSLIGMATGLPVERRLHASVLLAMVAAQNGARVLRVHDVGPTVEALRMLEAVQPELTET